MSDYQPTSELAKLLLVLVQEVAGISPNAFLSIHVENALKQADFIDPAANPQQTLNKIAALARELERRGMPHDDVRNRIIALLTPEAK